MKKFDFKSRFKDFVVSGLVSFRQYRFLNDPLKILMYHRFRADEDSGCVTKQNEFEQHLNFLCENFTFVDLNKDILECTSQAHDFKRPAALTVDDGYRNFFRYALPVLKKYSAPATIFIAYNFVDQGGWLWQDKNIYVLRTTKLKRSLFEFGSLRIEIQTDPIEKLFESMLKVYNSCVTLTMSQKHEFSRKLAEHLRVEIPEKPVREFEPLTWANIEALENSNVSVGAHTMNHTILTEVGEQEANLEILE